MDVFSVLADPNRRRLIQRIAAGPVRVVDLAADLPISRPAVSKHLRLLGAAGLVTAEPSGRETRYTFNAAALEPVIGFVQELRSRPPMTERVLDGLDLEVRRTVRDRRRQSPDTTASKERTA